MAVDKLVDSTQLDNNLTSVANAIRTKGGTSANLAFPSGFVSAIEDISGGGIEPVSPTYTQINTVVNNYITQAKIDYASDTSRTTSIVASYAGQTTDYRKDEPFGYSATVVSGDLQITDDSNSGSTTETVTSGSKTIYNITPTSAGGNFVNKATNISAVGHLVPTGALRMLYLPSVVNFRDIGGWDCYNSSGVKEGTINYGKLIRGGEINGNRTLSTADRNTMLNLFKIGAEADLRVTSESGAGTSPLLPSITYKNFPLNTYDLTDPDLIDAVQFIINNVINDIPTYYHCMVGADRTGGMSMIIESICGVNETDIDIDYELTTFGGTGFARARTSTEWTTWMGNFDSYSGTTIRDKVIDWLVKVCHITATQINSFRSKLINPTGSSIETISPSISTYTVTKTPTNVTISGETSATQYQPYEAEITPNGGYAITSVTVTMGGTDITEDVLSGTFTYINNSITNTYSNCSSSNAKTWCINGQGYVEDISANTNYEFTSGNVTVTMGGTDITSSVVMLLE